MIAETIAAVIEAPVAPATWESGDFDSFVAHREAMAVARNWVPLLQRRWVDGVWTEEPDVDRLTGLQRYRSTGGTWQFYDINFGYYFEGEFHRILDQQGRKSVEVRIHDLGDSAAPNKTGRQLTRLFEPLRGGEEVPAIEILRYRFNQYCQAVARRKAEEWRTSQAGQQHRERVAAHLATQAPAPLAARNLDRLCALRDELDRIVVKGKQTRATCTRLRENDPEADIADLEAECDALTTRYRSLKREIKTLEAQGAQESAPWDQEAA